MAAISIEERVGNPIKQGEITITPISKVVKILPNWLNGGLVWNRPIAVLIQSGSDETILPIPDITHQVVLFFIVFGLVSGFWVTRFRKRQR